MSLPLGEDKVIEMIKRGVMKGWVDEESGVPYAAYLERSIENKERIVNESGCVRDSFFTYN